MDEVHRGREIIGFSFKYLSKEQQRGLLLEEIRRTIFLMREEGVKAGAPFVHFLHYAYDDDVAREVTVHLSEELGQEGQFFPPESPNQISWIEFSGTPLREPED